MNRRAKVVVVALLALAVVAVAAVKLAARALAISTLFSAGILVTIAAIGAITAAAGRMAGDVGTWVNYVVSAVFFLVGLHLLDVIPAPWSGPGQVGVRRKGALAALWSWDWCSASPWAPAPSPTGPPCSR